jgi:hypothetical protein
MSIAAFVARLRVAPGGATKSLFEDANQEGDEPDDEDPKPGL